MDIESKLREARTQLGKSLVEVAHAVGTDVGNLSRIERGQPPNIGLARKIQDFYAAHNIPLSLDDVFPEPTNPEQAA